MKINLIGIAGTNGSGKDTVGQVLNEQSNFTFVSVTDSLRTEARRRGMAEDRAATRLISAEWRRKYGLAVLVDKVLEEYKPKIENGIGLSMASLRHPAEADRIHELGGIVLWIDADPLIRYNRIQANAAVRNRAAADNITFEQFMSDEQAEMHRSGDDATLDMSAVKAKADLSIINNFDSKEALAIEVTKQLKQFLKDGSEE